MKKAIKAKPKRALFILLIILALLSIGFFNPLVTKSYDLDSTKLPSEFDGFKIVQITDFHCKNFGNQEEPLIKKIKEADPDIICLTGDIIDEEHDFKNADYLLSKITQIAPVYYVSGNHEFYRGAPYSDFKELCYEYGVRILESETITIERGNSAINLSGLAWQNSTADMVNRLGYATDDYYNILLYHDSSKFNFLASYGYDLVLAGHIHGGLIRLPFIGGLLGSDYIFFPKYDYGIYQEKGSTMISSSGLGDARVPRWNNPREIVEITLHSIEKEAQE